MSDREELIERLEEQVWIDEPFAGFVDCGAYRSISPAWPGETWEDIRRTEVISSGDRDVWMYVFSRAGSEQKDVPIAVVFDKTNDEPRARVYYNKAHFGSSEPRRPLVGREESSIPDDVARYIAAMRSGDRALLSAAVDLEAEFPSPFGPVTGADFVENFSRPGGSGVPGVPLEVCTVTTDGRRHAVEFISWRKPPHGGLGCYEFIDGKLSRMSLFEGPVRR